MLLTVPLIDTHVLWQDPWVIARIREGVPSLPLQESLPGDQRDAAYVALVTAMAAGASQRDVATARSIKDHKRVGSYLLNVSQQKTGLGSANKKKFTPKRLSIGVATRLEAEIAVTVSSWKPQTFDQLVLSQAATETPARAPTETPARAPTETPARAPPETLTRAPPEAHAAPK